MRLLKGCVLILLIWAVQIQHTYRNIVGESVSSVVVSSPDARWESSEPRHTDAPIPESGWISVSSQCRTVATSDADVESLDRDPLEGTASLVSNPRQTELMGARPYLDAARYGRDVSQPTTVPPPAIASL
jgi:hypothetical protein